MIKLNWNIFKAKFDGQENLMFELLAYHLFCDEYNIPTGIFRFKNQAGIETEPIKIGGIFIGFQAKFYEAKINKEDIIKSIITAKSKNPNLNKVLLYLNKEFSESSNVDKKDPKYKIEIEEKAKELNVELEWKVLSNFEIQLAKPSLSYLSEYFFSDDKSRIDSLKEIDNHTKSILSSIHCDIVYQKGNIKIDRSEILRSIHAQIKLSKSIVISGNGGTGKTAIIKELFGISKETPFYIFKANEFQIQNINDLFSPYSLTFTEFLESHKEEKSKLVVIDSAERLSEIVNNEPFKEFVASLVANQWCIVFTTRNNYLDDLRFQLIHIYRLKPNNISIENLSEDELDKLAQSYNFIVPPDARLKRLIRNPFYLNQYLSSYSEDSQKDKYSEFKTNLWNIKIQNSSFTKDNINIERENCFVSLAYERSESGIFYSKAEGYSNHILSLLKKDEIIEYSSINSGYFITHDIYEEWALDLWIERVYQKNIGDVISFFDEIGTSLSIRRAFRLWISDKLYSNSNEVEQLIEEVIYSKDISASWRDEVFISILLSNLSSTFFREIKEMLFADNFFLLKRVIFLLRTACKEVDEYLMRLLSNNTETGVKYVFTKPKGNGWGAIINLVYEEINLFKIKDAPFLIPILNEWNDEFKTGSITKNATKIALKFYVDIVSEKNSYRYSDLSKKIIKILVNGANEISNELKEIFDNVIINNWSKHNSPYNELCEFILNNTHDCIPIIQTLPNEVIRIADLFWFKSSKNDDMFGSEGMNMEQYYSMNDNGSDLPASAFKTPIYWLLKFSPKETFDFILSFTNKTVEFYSKSKYGDDVEILDVFVNDTTIQKQFGSNALWSMHRGTGSPVTPYTLQSIHMALEKFLLETAKDDESSDLIRWLKYLISNSKSVSITSVVASVVKAYPDKYFEIAETLFKTIKLFSYDLMLLTSERSAGMIYQIGIGMNPQNTSYENERIKTLDDPHRKTTIEHIALNYQFFKSKNTKDEEAEKRQNAIWSIIDNHEKNKLNNTQKLLLSRIDRRKMKPKIEQKDDKIVIEFNSEIEPELKKFSEDSQKEVAEHFKYTALLQWSKSKFDTREGSPLSTQYENNPNLIIKEIKELLNPDIVKSNHLDYSTPAFAIYALLKEYSKSLSTEELEFCRDIILDYASAPLKEGYGYQISDGVEVAINTIPFLYELFPDKVLEYNILLLLILFDEHPLGSYKRVCDYSIESIVNSLWNKSSEDALKIIYGFFNLKPFLNDYVNELKEDKVYSFGNRKPHAILIQEFVEKHGDKMEEFIQVNYKNISIIDVDFKDYKLNDLDTTLQLIPHDTTNNILISFVSSALPIFTEKLLNNDRESNLYSLRMRFFKKVCPFILMRNSHEIKSFMSSFVKNFTSSEEVKYLLEEFISTENRITRYEQFWLVWEEFYYPIVNMSKQGGGSYDKGIVYSYLLARNWWSKEAKDWHSLKVIDKKFYKKIVSEIGDNVYVLDSIAQILNQIGSGFLNDGIVWISDMLGKNGNLWTEKLGVNTIYYLELIIRKYLFINRTEVRRNKDVKERVLIILNFLIEKSSVNAYLLREDIL
jgi:hypothetical protein